MIFPVCINLNKLTCTDILTVAVEMTTSTNNFIVYIYIVLSTLESIEKTQIVNINS